MKAKNRLTGLDTYRVDVVDRGAVRDPENPTDTNRFLLWKSETPLKEKPVTATNKLAAALAKAADNEAQLDELIGKDESITPARAATIKGAYRLLKAENAELTVEDFAKGAFPGAAPPFGADNQPKAHAFQPKETPDGTCAAEGCGLGGNAAVHADEGASSADGGAKGTGENVEAAEKTEDEQVVEVATKTEDAPVETEKAEATLTDVEKAVEAMPEGVRELVKAQLKTAADQTALAKAEIEKAEANEVTLLVKAEMTHVPGVSSDALSATLLTMKRANKAQYDAILPILKASSAAIKGGNALKENGTDNTGKSAGDLKSQHEAIAKGIQKAEGISLQKAKAQAWERNPELMRQYNDAQALAQAGAA